MSTRSPRLALLEWSKLTHALACTFPKPPERPRWGDGMVVQDVAHAVDAAESDKATFLRCPHTVLDKLFVQSAWQGDGVTFTVVAGPLDRYKCQTLNWFQAHIIGTELRAAGVPVEIVAEYQGTKTGFFKQGLTWAEQHVAKRKLEEAKTAAEKEKDKAAAAAREYAKADAKARALAAQANEPMTFVMLNGPDIFR